MLGKTEYDVLPQDEYSDARSEHIARPNRLSQMITWLLTGLLLITVSFVAGTQYHKLLPADSFGIELAWCKFVQRYEEPQLILFQLQS